MEEKRIIDFIEKERNAQNIPGMAAAVFKNGELFEEGSGVIEIGKDAPVRPETVFGTASLTKTFTALAIMILQAEGELSVHDPVVRHLPELEQVAAIRDSEIRHLLSHTTGLPPLERRESIVGFEAHVDYLQSAVFEPLGRPGERLSYSNDAFLLLGAIIGQVSGTDYQSFITERIIRPAGMTRTSFDPPPQGTQENVAVQYAETGGELRPVEWPSLGNYAVGGGIRSTVRDLMKYARLYIDDEYRERVLKVRLDVSEMWSDVQRAGRFSSYGYGLTVSRDFHGLLFVHHGGSQPGVSSAIGFIPEKRMAAVVLTNRSEARADRILHGILNIGLGRDPEDDPFREPEYDMAEDEFGRFNGVYVNDEDPEGFEIRLDGGRPVMSAGGKTDELRASGPSTLVNERTSKPVEFMFGEDGKPASAFMGLRIFRRKG
ncbi:serine hydrolase domain-containing protein [Bhargavaea cecembensis]|uniref:serine hydrolase domain-containing protein n=1 Tax=Bhargavaea cecembensis TaxID=394098 RepID=UPI00058EBFF8|nr:serine hydrolase domain-containing protein [Bhargavaea cecembensis]